MYLRIVVLLSTLLLSSLCSAHADHGHDTAHSPIDAAHWRAALQRFSRIGHPADLAIARAALQQRIGREADATLEVLYLSAWTSQADHRFADAQRYTNELLHAKPRWGAAQLMRAGLALVRGDYDKARAVCQSLTDVTLAMRLACQAQTLQHATPKQHHAIAAGLRAAVAQLSEDVEQLAWFQLVLGDLAVRAGVPGDAVGHYRLAVKYAPSVRGQVALAQTLLDLGRPDAALAVLPARSPALAIRVKRLVAARQLRHPAMLLRQESRGLEQLFEQWRQQGDLTHGREMAEYYLRVKRQPRCALDILRTTLTWQREYEDEQLLREARQALVAWGYQPPYAKGSRHVRALAYTGPAPADECWSIDRGRLAPDASKPASAPYITWDS